VSGPLLFSRGGASAQKEVDHRGEGLGPRKVEKSRKRNPRRGGGATLLGEERGLRKRQVRGAENPVPGCGTVVPVSYRGIPINRRCDQVSSLGKRPGGCRSEEMRAGGGLWVG